MKKSILMFVAPLLLAGILTGCEQKKDTASIPITNHNDSISYIIGADYAALLMNNGIEVNPEAFYKGFDLAIKGMDQYPDSVKIAMINELNIESQKKAREQQMALAKQNKELGAKFLAENKKKEGVEQLPDGLQYKIFKRGQGPTPMANDSVLIHYRAMFIDGTTFDESYKRGPQVARLNGMVKGLSEGLQMMNEGSIYELYMPSDLAYGDQGISDVIPGGSAIIYNVELIKIF
jgi:FKBP-type peptidyl-prolyl cis-trans isomerase